MTHSYKTRSNKNTINALKKLKTVRFNIVSFELNPQTQDHALRITPRDPRVNYYGFYRNYHEKYSKKLRRSSR